MEYSAVTQPLPVPLRNGGTDSSTLAVQMTLVSPHSIRQEPSACFVKCGVIFIGRISSRARPSIRFDMVMFPFVVGMELWANTVRPYGMNMSILFVSGFNGFSSIYFQTARYSRLSRMTLSKNDF